jgi:hypothetical protein
VERRPVKALLLWHSLPQHDGHLRSPQSRSQVCLLLARQSSVAGMTLRNIGGIAWSLSKDRSEIQMKNRAAGLHIARKRLPANPENPVSL